MYIKGMRTKALSKEFQFTPKLIKILHTFELLRINARLILDVYSKRIFEVVFFSERGTVGVRFVRFTVITQNFNGHQKPPSHIA